LSVYNYIQIIRGEYVYFLSMLLLLLLDKSSENLAHIFRFIHVLYINGWLKHKNLLDLKSCFSVCNKKRISP
jgi:hypothetical protein